MGAAVYLNEYAKPGKLVSTIEFATETLARNTVNHLWPLRNDVLWTDNRLWLQYPDRLTDTDTHGAASHHKKYTGGTENCTGQLQTRSSRTWSRKMAHHPHHLLPSAMPGIITGVILAIGRIVGESAALLFTAGSAGMLPKVASGYFSKIMQSGGTLTIKLYLAATSEGKFDQAFGIAVVLLVIVFLINIHDKGVWQRNS